MVHRQQVCVRHRRRCEKSLTCINREFKNLGPLFTTDTISVGFSCLVLVLAQLASVLSINVG
jgi:hypothetical protein